MSRLSFWKTIFFLCAFGAAQAASAAQTFTRLRSFDGADGANPYAGVVQGTDGSFYGTTQWGGVHTGCGISLGCGTVFKVTAGGRLTTLYSFCAEPGCADGYAPVGGLTLATSGNFLGSTSSGGIYNAGTLFEITPSGKLTTVLSFDGTDGAKPQAPPVQATDGNLYGTTSAGGSSGAGTVFKITTGGTLVTLYSFCAETNCTDGSSPNGLVQGADGNFYGSASRGGANDYGTVFKITPGGKLTTLYNFCAHANCTDGGYPYDVLIQASGGNFYGTTSGFGTPVYGTVFRITPAGALTTLLRFQGFDGAYPHDALIQATDGDIYGTTASGGGLTDAGVVFETTPGGTVTKLHSFDGTDGFQPYAGLVQATSGRFYGTTYGGGTSGNCADGCGTVFSLAVGLGPFVETLPTSGKVGAAVKILGNNLEGATRVTFNGTKATFRVVSNTEITATVPKGATTGTVKVKTPSRTLTSNMNFRVP